MVFPGRYDGFRVSPFFASCFESAESNCDKSACRFLDASGFEFPLLVNAYLAMSDEDRVVTAPYIYGSSWWDDGLSGLSFNSDFFAFPDWVEFSGYSNKLHGCLNCRVSPDFFRSLQGSDKLFFEIGSIVVASRSLSLGDYLLLSPEAKARIDVPSGALLDIVGVKPCLDVEIIDGSVYCWGSNSFGALGDGSTDNSFVPVKVVGGYSFESILTGSSHSCGLLSDGSLYCWGSNTHSILNDGSHVYSYVPIRMFDGYFFDSVSLGESHACGLLLDGSAYCWGKNNYGKLGDGTTRYSSVPIMVHINTI